jgi:hypothetical protein
MRIRALFCISLLTVMVAATSYAETDKRWKNVIGPDAVKRQMQWLKENEERKKQVVQADLPSHKPEVRACLNSDLVGGMWKRIYFKESPEGGLTKQNKRQKHYYLSMDAEGYFANVRYFKSIDDPNEALKLMKFNKNEKSAQKFTLKEGEMRSGLDLFSGKMTLATYDCNIVTKASTVFVEGDMVLHGSTNNGNTMLYELFRRWF